MSDILGVEEAKKIRGVREIVFVKQIGEQVGKIGSSTDRAGFVIAQADTAQEAVAICEEAMKTIKIEIK